MKIKIFILTLLLALLSFGPIYADEPLVSDDTVGIFVYAETTTDITMPNPIEIVEGIKGATSWSDLIGLETALYMLLILVGGYLSAYIPILKKIDNGTYRVLTWAVLVVAGGWVIGFGNVWAAALAYFFSTSLYEVVLKWILGKSPKPEKG